METEKIDRRIRRTKKQLLQSLTQLLSEKKLNKITVSELTELADVNRTTFYLYYKDVFDMVEQIEADIFENFNIAYERFLADKDSFNEMLNFFTFLFEFVQDNFEICRLLLGPEGDYAFVEKFKKAIKRMQPVVDENTFKDNSIYFRSFIITGCIGVMQQWLEDSTKASPREMAEFLSKIIYKDIT